MDQRAVQGRPAGDALCAGDRPTQTDLLDRSGLAAGCAVVAVTVASDTPDLLEHAGAIFRTWIDHLTDLYASSGWATAESRAFATLVIAATEGTVLLSRAQHDRTTFDTVASALLDQAKAASRK